MASTRNSILNAFKSVIDAITSGSFGEPEAVIGLLKPNQVGTTPRVEVWWHSDHGSHVDTKSLRTLRIVTALKLKYDASDTADRGATQLHQASDAYDAIHAAIETAFNTRGSATTPFTGLGYLVIEQEEPGIQCDGFDDQDDYLRIGEVWRVEYRRTEGAT